MNLELMKYFTYDVDTATSSAFVQQRNKILPIAFELLFHEFTSIAATPNYYKGYRMVAVDGSDLCISHNPKDTTTYFPNGSNARGFNQLHLNAMYDLCSHIYVDAIVQPAREENEFKALTDMVDRSTIEDKVIIIADRGYESYNVFEHIAKKGWNYVIRVKDINSNGITSSLILPEQESFDVDYDFLMTRRQTNHIKAHPEIYKFLPSNKKFDYLPVGSKETYPFRFRILRFPISKDSYEVIITNLNREDFPLERIKEIYHMRWDIMLISA